MPASLPSKIRDKQRLVSLSESELRTLSEAADATGRDISEIIRDGSIKYAERLMKHNHKRESEKKRRKALARYWTKGKCEIEAKKYKTRTEFLRNCPSAHAVAVDKNWLDDVCSHMKYLPPSYWTKANCKKAAKKYDTRSRFKNMRPQAYRVARENDWLDDICRHMRTRPPKGYWTKEKCAAEAKKYNGRIDFYKGSLSAYRSASKHKWLNDICGHMKQQPQIYWTKEKCAAEAKKYSSRTEFSDNANGAYRKSSESGWMDDVCSHMVSKKKPDGYWTKERCAAEAKKYNSRSELRRNCSGAYHYSLKNKWIDEVCSHMPG